MPSLRGLHLHFDPVSGIAGDMAVAALVHAGVPQTVVSRAIAAVGVRGLRVRFETRRRGAFVGQGFIVDEPGRRGRTFVPEVAPPSARPGPATKKKPRSSRGHSSAAAGHAHEHDHDHDHDHDHEHDHEHEHGHLHAHHTGMQARAIAARGSGDHRDYADIRRLLRRAKLDPDAKALAQEIFARLAEVEAALHGSRIDRVAFHEVGAYDSIADIVGMSAAIAWLSPASIGSSPPVVGTGTVSTAHGIVPVPAPATAALLRGLPMIFEGPGELTTPTGAALLATVVDSFGPPPPMRVTAIGYGAGTRIVPDRSNVLRVMLGAPIGKILPAAAADVLVIESNIDDMDGQLIAALFDALFAAGALDVWAAPILMKKGRPAQQISALAEPSRVAAVERAFFLHSTTLGVRILPVSRVTLARSVDTVDTAYGQVRIKVAGLDGEAIGAHPEYEDCRRRATAARVPVRRVWAAAVAAAASLTAATVSSRRSQASLSPSPQLSPRPARRKARRKTRV